MIEDNWPQFDSFHKHVTSLSKDILKNKHEWLTSSDVFSIFYDLVYEAILNISIDEKLNGNLWDLLEEEKAKLLTITLKEYFLSIPRKYDVFIPIPNITIDLSESIKLSENCSLEIYDKPDDIPGGYRAGPLGIATKLTSNKLYFKYSIEGYCNNNLENMSVKKSLSNFKIAIQQYISKGLFIFKEGSPAGFGLLGGLTHFQIQKCNLISSDQTTDKGKIITTELPLELSKLLNSLTINNKSGRVKAALDEGNLNKMLADHLKLPAQLMECSEIEARRVKFAIEWCFDSYASNNTTLSFLQTCIGLEALFGEDSSSESLTKMLADRCSYLISNDIKGRKQIKENFIKLYGIRSKLVHGVETSINSDQKGFLDWGRNVLEVSIIREIKHLKLDKT